MPASIAARISRPPGSETVGVPASDTSAMLSPCCSRAMSARRLPRFVVLVQARGRRGDGVAREQMRRAARVFGRDQRDFAQHPQRPHGDVFEVADRRGDHEQRAGHVSGAFIVPLADRVVTELVR